MAPSQDANFVKKKKTFLGGGAMAHQVYFTYFEPSQTLVGAKMGDLHDKSPDHPQAGLGLSHM